MTPEMAQQVVEAAGHIARQFRRFPMADRDDLVGAGALAAVQAHPRYDANRGTRFTTYANPAMRKAIAAQAHRMASVTGGSPHMVAAGRLQGQQRAAMIDFTAPPPALRERVRLRVAQVLADADGGRLAFPVLLGDASACEVARKRRVAIWRVRCAVREAREVLRADGRLRALWEEVQRCV